MDSGIGMSLVCSGFSTQRMESVFSAGLRGMDTADSSAVSDLVLDTLRKVASDGFDARALETSLHRLELSSMEIGRIWPYTLMSRVYRSWMNGGDPLCWLNLDRHLAELHERTEGDPGYLVSVLQEQLCGNLHRVDATFHPDPGLTGRKESELQRKMHALREGMTEEDLERISADASALAEMQSTPDPPGAVALLPRLSLSEVEREPALPSTVRLDPGGIPLLVTDVFSNGVCHIEISLGIEGLDEDLMPLVPLFCDAVIGMGAGDSDWEEMATREAACCGGLSAAPAAICGASDTGSCSPALRFGTRCLERTLPDALDLISDRILRTDFSDRKRLADLIREEASEAESMVVARGNSFAVLRAARGLNRASALREEFEGISSLRVFLDLASGRSADPGLVSDLERIHRFVTDRIDLACSTVCPPSSLYRIEEWLEGMGKAASPAVQAVTGLPEPGPGSREGIALPVSVSYAGLSVPAIPFTHELAPALRFLTRQLGYGYLWDEIRVRRGAYGAAAVFDTSTGVFSLSSYRDPDTAGTLDTFAGLPDYIENRMDLSAETVEAGVISALKDLDPSDRPGIAVSSAMSRHISRTGPDELRKHWSGLLELSAETVRRASREILRPVWKKAPVCVVSSRDVLEADGTGFEISDLAGG
jgi:Zn-dependent M16 (insulinase) family peptidase